MCSSISYDGSAQLLLRGADRHTPGGRVAEGQANQPGGGWFEEPTPEGVLVRFETQDALAGWHMLCLWRWKHLTSSIQNQLNFQRGQNLLFELFRGGLFTSTKIGDMSTKL